MSTSPLAATRVVTRAGALLEGYELIISDVWGVLHDGRRAYAEAGAALARARASGATVMLLSNAPLPGPSVERLLAEKGVRRDAWDGIVTSGDITAAHVDAERYAHIHHVGPDRDLALFGHIAAPRVALDDAEALVVTGLVDDDTETAETYRAPLTRALVRKLPLVCANPDLVVDVGGRLYPCAGAIAALYQSLGGPVFWAGKPHRIAYDTVVAAAARSRGRATPPERTLAIGDAVRTDLEGARRFGIASLFVGAGIHRDEIMIQGRIDPARLGRLLAPPAPAPIAAIAELAW